MNVLVCMKQILDPEVPARDFRLDAAKKEAEQGSASLVTNIFCENALETALQFRERAGGGTITVLSFGAESAEDTLRKALAMKADAAALVVGDVSHPLHVARVLAAAVRRLGGPALSGAEGFDVIFTGRESGDWGAGQTGALLAEELGVPCVSFADSLERSGDVLRIRRQTEWGWEIVEARPPLVVTITNDEHNVPRIPKVRDVMMAHRQPLTRFEVGELGVDAGEYYELVELAIPQKESHCQIVADVDELAQRIAEITAAL